MRQQNRQHGAHVGEPDRPIRLHDGADLRPRDVEPELHRIPPRRADPEGRQARGDEQQRRQHHLPLRQESLVPLDVGLHQFRQMSERRIVKGVAFQRPTRDRRTRNRCAAAGTNDCPPGDVGSGCSGEGFSPVLIRKS